MNNTIGSPTRFMTALPLPYFDPITHKIHFGLACYGCRYTFERSFMHKLFLRQCQLLRDHRDKTYTGGDSRKGMSRCTSPVGRPSKCAYFPPTCRKLKCPSHYALRKVVFGGMKYPRSTEILSLNAHYHLLSLV